MFGISTGEMMIVAIILLLAVGPDKMPNLMRTLGSGLRRLRQAQQELKAQTGIDELMRETAQAPAEAPKPEPALAKLSEADLRRERPDEGADLHFLALSTSLATPASAEPETLARPPQHVDPKSDHSLFAAAVEPRPLEDSAELGDS